MQRSKDQLSPRFPRNPQAPLTTAEDHAIAGFHRGMRRCGGLTLFARGHVMKLTRRTILQLGAVAVAAPALRFEVDQPGDYATFNSKPGLLHTSYGPRLLHKGVTRRKFLETWWLQLTFAEG
jgi:hypothetical protein